MGQPTKQDPTGQASNRRKATVKLQNRFTRAQREVKALFRQIPRKRRQKTTLQNSLKIGSQLDTLLETVSHAYKTGNGDSVGVLINNVTIPVYDYQITPSELEELNRNIRNIVDDAVLETRTDRLPPNWWWQEVVEVPYREGAAGEIRDFNQLITEELVKVRQRRGLPTQRLEFGSIAQSAEYQAALQSVYVRNFQGIKALSDRTADQVVQTINAGMQAGMTPTEIGKMIEKRFDVARSGAKRTAETEVNKAFNDARLDAADAAAKVTGLRAGVLHLSALIPTTREGHAARHGNAYTTEQQRQWWDAGANRINCHCSTRTVLIDPKGNVIDIELQEEIKAERNLFEKVEETPPPTPTKPAPKRRRKKAAPPAPPADAPKYKDRDEFRAEMLRQFEGPFTVGTNRNGDKILPEVMETFGALAAEYNLTRHRVRRFIVSNKDAQGRSVKMQERGHVGLYGDGAKVFFIHSGKPKKRTFISPLANVKDGGELRATITHEFAHLMYVTREKTLNLELEGLWGSELYTRYRKLGAQFNAEKQRKLAEISASLRPRIRSGEIGSVDEANEILRKDLAEHMQTWLADHEDKELFISEYAFSSRDETLAEGFAAYKLRKNPGALAEAIGKFFDTHFKQE